MVGARGTGPAMMEPPISQYHNCAACQAEYRSAGYCAAVGMTVRSMWDARREACSDRHAAKPVASAKRGLRGGRAADRQSLP